MISTLNLSLTSIHAIADLETSLKEIEGYEIELIARDKIKVNAKSILEIKSIVASRIKGSSVFGMESKTRKMEQVKARQISMHFIKESHPFMSLKSIGREFGGRDHSTVINALRMVQDYCDTEKHYKDLVFQIGQIIYQR